MKLPPDGYRLTVYDDVPATHALAEVSLPDGEMAQARGYVFVPLALAAEMGEPDDTVTFGSMTWPAWRLSPAPAP